MNRTFCLALALVGAATALTACDYAKYSPGVNPQYKDNFSWTPTWHTSDVYRDSVNNSEHVEKPVGVGSATAIKNGSVQDKINSAPAGQSATSPQSANGKLGPVNDQSTSNSKTPVDKSQAPK